MRRGEDGVSDCDDDDDGEENREQPMNRPLIGTSLSLLGFHRAEKCLRVELGKNI